MKRAKDFIILGLFACIVFLYTCNKPKVVTNTVTKTITRIDSLVVTDTIDRWIKVPYAVVPEIKPPTYTFNDDRMDLRDTSVFLSEVDTFYYGEKDSSLRYSIRVYGKTKPIGVDLEYEFLERTIKDSIYIRDSVYTAEVLNKSFLSAGAMIVGNRNSLGFAPMITYSHKKGNNYSIGYDVVNKNLMVGFTKKISFR